jgi:hypothetical protein
MDPTPGSSFRPNTRHSQAFYQKQIGHQSPYCSISRQSWQHNHTYTLQICTTYQRDPCEDKERPPTHLRPLLQNRWYDILPCFGCSTRHGQKIRTLAFSGFPGVLALFRLSRCITHRHATAQTTDEPEAREKLA